MPCFQVEHCEEGLKTVQTFLSLADKAATQVEDSVLQALHDYAHSTKTIQTENKHVSGIVSTQPSQPQLMFL